MPAKCKNNPRRSQHTRRSFQQRPDHRVMPHKIVHRAWLSCGNQVAVARINDLYIVQRFDASERPVGSASRFTGGSAASTAIAFARGMARL
tara:strand:+ start:2499 stop:2771 length:273 start_codon:yes stop_codon:yes gene_type:complete